MEEVNNFTEQIHILVTPAQKAIFLGFIAKYSDLYPSISHFFRASALYNMKRVEDLDTRRELWKPKKN